MTEASEPVRDVHETPCCVVGGGPAGMVLALLLARRGVEVTLLEAHADFDRDFRGDTVHPSTLEILDQLGLAEPLLKLPHGKVRALSIVAGGETATIADLGRFPTRFPFVMMLPQARFLEFLATEAARYPTFRLVMRASVQALLRDDGGARGVRYRGADDAWHEVRAPLTVAADGRFSRLRMLAGLTPAKTAPPMDVVWFRLPKKPEDGGNAGTIHAGNGHFVVLLDRGDSWQVGYAILKGSFAQLKAAGPEVIRRTTADLVPWLADRLDALADLRQVAVLSVESSRLACWHQPGLLFIGDAAHVMSPVGGVGINVAIQDAVAAANLLAEPLRQGRVEPRHLAAVQKRREWPTRVIQAFQRVAQAKIAAPALDPRTPFRLPLAVRIVTRLPVLRTLPGRLIALGPRRERVRDPRPDQPSRRS